MLERLSPPDRQLLFRFLCAFAWADGEVRDAERRFVRRLMSKVALPEAERLDVEAWLLHPPDASDTDPRDIPAEHRQLFVHAMRALIFMDGVVTNEEEIALDTLQRSLGL